MRRRTFISAIPAVSGAAIGAPGAVHATSGDTVTEPARKVPVFADTDVLVAGGGPAGVAAAISAARAGSSVILVERYNHLGGLWTGGMVLPLLSNYGLDKKGEFKKVIFGISDEIAAKLASMGMAINEVNPVVDPEATKYLLDKMMTEAGVRVLYHCWASNVIVENGAISAVLVESKSGRIAIRPKVVVDCTGDGDIFHHAGEQYSELKFYIGLVHRLGNIDRIDTTKPGYKKMDIGGPTPIPSVNWVNLHGEDDRDGIDVATLSELQQKYRIAIWEQTEKIRATPGYEQVFLLDTASQLGVRMSRILEGAYTLTLDDSMTYKAFDDVIGISGAWISVNFKGKRYVPKERPLWQIPYRSLVPKKTHNLLVAGRCFSFEKALVEDARIIGTCLVTGHGAGAAASVAVKSRASVRDVDVKAVQRILKDQGANLG